MLKPGTFIDQAIKLLQHPRVQEYKSKGYRISTTGHSLGGFLAQVCVYWAQRSEFKDTYYPEMSAVVFDAPGVVDFLQVIQSNIFSQQNRIDITKLNIHNFCAMPTIVSTYGTQTGTLWHLLGDENIPFAFIEAHLMEHILDKFDRETGQPKRFRQMSDWPRANYSNFIENMASGAALSPFGLMNSLYKKIKTLSGYESEDKTWYDQVLGQEKSQVSSFLSQASALGDPSSDNQQFSALLSSAIQAHYAYLAEPDSQKQMSLFHFDEATQVFLKEVMKFKESTSEICRTHLYQEYESVADELKALQLKKSGNSHWDVILSSVYSETIFDFQYLIQDAIREKTKLSFQGFLTNSVESIQSRVTDLEESIKELSGPMARKKQKEIDELNRNLEAMKAQITEINKQKDTTVFNVRTAVANVPNSWAIRELSGPDYEPARNQELLKVIDKAKPGQRYNIDSATADAPGATAVVTSRPEGVSPGTADFVERYKTAGLFRPAHEKTGGSSFEVQEKNEGASAAKK